MANVVDWQTNNTRDAAVMIGCLVVQFMYDGKVWNGTHDVVQEPEDFIVIVFKATFNPQQSQMVS